MEFKRLKALKEVWGQDKELWLCGAVVAALIISGTLGNEGNTEENTSSTYVQHCFNDEAAPATEEQAKGLLQTGQGKGKKVTINGVEGNCYNVSISQR